MGASCTERAKRFKSRLPVVATFLRRSRDRQAQRARVLAERVRRLEKALEEQSRTIRQQRNQLERASAENQALRGEVKQLRERPPILPEDPQLPRHEFGPKMISLCVNLASRVGLRAVPDVLRGILEWLGIQAKIPTWTAIRTWIMRVGIAAIEQPVEPADDWCWMTDHSNQIGPEKVLSILGVRASKMPPPGQPLRHEDVRVLELLPGTRWKREDVRDVYEQVAGRCGVPLAVLADGAVELREGAEMSGILQKNGRRTVVLGDFKHHAANVLKKNVGNAPRFAEFMTQLGRTRSSIQQTELAHFTPPSPKPKARFMNLQPTLRWARMALWHTSHPESAAHRGITRERMAEKLGWLRDYQQDIDRWHVCQEIVSAASTFINQQGLSRGIARQLRNHLRSLPCHPMARDEDACRQVTVSLLRFVRRSEAQLTPGQRLPLSTEILESSFGRFKQLEGQHSKGGFTSLLAAYGSLLTTTTPQTIRRDFARVSVQQMKQWHSERLGTTLTSRRQTAYRESLQGSNPDTNQLGG